MKSKTILCLLAIFLVALVPLAVVYVTAAGLALPALSKIGAAAVGLFMLGMTFSLKDDDPAVNITRAMPDGNETVASDGIDLGHGAQGDFLANCEVSIEAPAVTTVELPNTETFTYDLWHDVVSGFGSETLLQDNVLTQTGAGGAGAAAASASVRLPVDAKRYVRLKIAGSTLATDTTGKNATFRLVF